MNDENNVKRVIPMIMLVFISSATMISVINIISPQLTVDFGISPTTVSLLSMTVMLRVHFTGIRYPAGRFFCNLYWMEVCVPDSTGLAGSPSFHMQVCAGRKAESGGQAGYCGAGAVGGVHIPHIHVF